MSLSLIWNHDLILFSFWSSLPPENGHSNFDSDPLACVTTHALDVSAQSHMHTRNALLIGGSSIGGGARGNVPPPLFGEPHMQTIATREAQVLGLSTVEYTYKPKLLAVFLLKWLSQFNLSRVN